MTTTQPAALPERIWTCQIGGHGELPQGADGPMRDAIASAFKAVTGSDATYCFSGWGHSLPERYRAVVEDRLPDPEVIRRECFAVLDTLPDAVTAPGGDFAALQPQPAAAVSDAEIIAIKKATKAADPTQPWGDTLAFARAILALRPQAVPSLDTLKQHLACDIECSVYENTVLPAIERWECHHGITAQAKEGGA